MSLKDITRVILKSLVLSSPEPLRIDQLERDYLQQEGQPIPFSNLGFANLKSFLLSMPETLAYDPDTRTFTVAKNEIGKSDHIHKLVSGQKNNKSKTKNTKPFNHSKHFNYNGQNREPQTYKIWDNHPLNPNQLNYNRSYGHPNYNENYGQPIINQPNYRVNPLPAYPTRPFEPGNLLSAPNYIRDSLLGLPPLLSINVPNPITSVTNQTPASRYCSSGRPNNVSKVKHDTIKKNSTSNSSSSTSIEPSHKKLDGDTDGKADLNSDEIGALPPMDEDDPIKFIGSKMMSTKYGRCIPQATMPKTLKPGHIQQIFVTEVTKFPYFYFQFAGTDETMRGLQEELNLTYDDDFERTDQIRKSEIQIGNVCAAYYKNKWSRAEILIDLGNQLKLLFVDYGTIGFVSIKKTRYLRSEVCEIPRLCHRGVLAFIEPLEDGKFEKKIIDKFCSMVTDRSLMVVFSNVDESEDLSMTLVDTSDEKVDLIINKILMEEICGYKSDDDGCT